MKFFIKICITSLLLFGCKKQSEISKEFNCNKLIISNLKEVIDVKKTFSVQLPKTWKTNLYFDETQSSIYTADTTKQLTETFLLDVTHINKNINFNATFKLKQEQESLSENLLQTQAKEIQLGKKAAFYRISKGKKIGFLYQECHTFIKINQQNFILAKIAIYGDSLVQKRLCTAFSLLEKIKTF